MNYTVKTVSLKDIRKFIEDNHYSKSINGCKASMSVGLFDIYENLVGAVLFGELSTTAWKRFASSEKDVVELRRLVCAENCPKNTESWFLSRALKLLKHDTEYKICVSYADPYHGHLGVIYQAANWSYFGTTNPDVLLETPEGRLYHSRALRTKYKGEYKPFAKRLREMNEAGLLKEVKVPGKHTYTYTLTGKHKRVGEDYPKHVKKEPT